MSTPRNSPVPETLDQWMRRQEKDSLRAARRPAVTSAVDLLGPGFGPRATRILDWNSEEARFTGFFYSEDDALNTPDLAGVMYWMGQTISTGHHGQQIAWSHGTSGSALFHRFFHVHENQMPIFGAWSRTVPETHDDKRVGTVTTDWHVAGEVLSTPVTFSSPLPTGSTPVIQLTPNNSSNPHHYSVGAITATNEGFTLSTYRTSGTGPLTIGYTAILPI